MADKEDVHVQAKIYTKLKKYQIQDTLLSIPSISGTLELNALVKGLLLSEDSGILEFDFLINGEYFEADSLASYINEKSISTESVIEIEYILKQKEPKLERSLLHNDWVSSIDVENDLIITGTYDSLVNIWSKKNGKLLCAAESHSMAVKHVLWNKHENNEISFLSASQDQSVLIWMYKRPESKCFSIHSCRGHAGSVDCLALHPRTHKFASGSWDKMIKIWDSKIDLHATNEDIDDSTKKSKKNSMNNAPTIRTPLITLSGHKEPVSSLLWIDDKLVSAGWDHCIRFWDCETATNTFTFTGNKVYLSISYSASSHLLASGSTDKYVRLWDPRVSDGTVVKSMLSSHNGWISSVEWSPSNEYHLVSGSYDNSVKLWDIRSTKKSITNVESHQDKVMCVRWVENDLVLSGGADSQVHITKLDLNE
ncbi:ribosome biogenesis protein wdr12 [Hydra vulgaris]|uniref:Ribosome biogenesis protein WDR12 homolog n=1 Tax=Hydra vulgaris TaxID=6087 RepID=A0ABM4DIX5_HYDVU